MDNQSKHSQTKLIHLLTSIAFYSVIFAWLLFTVSNQHLEQSSDIANIFGQGMLSTQSSTMNGTQEDSFASGDLLLVEMLDNESYIDLKSGQIVTYFDDSQHIFITHRINSTYYEDGILYLQTQGDQAQMADMPIKASEVLAIYKNKVQGGGEVLDYLQTPKGFIIFVLLPVTTVLLYELLILTKNIINYKKIKFENSLEKRYLKALKSLEIETFKIRQKILSNWVSKNDNP